MGPDDHLDFAGGNLLQNGLPLSLLDAAPNDGNLIIQWSQKSFGIQEMLLGKNFRRRHQRGLKSIRYRNDNRFKGDNCLTAANISLQQTNHRVRSFQILNNLFENPLLSSGRMKRKNHLHPLTNVLGGREAYPLQAATLYTAKSKDQLQQ